MDTGDTAFVLVSSSLVMFMTPGLALFYGGMVRTKNVLGTLMQSMFALGLVSILWVLIGYTLAFGPDVGGLIGGLDFLGFAGVGQTPNVDLAPTIPHVAFAGFQLMFAVITPALITGAFAERMKFSGYVAFTAAVARSRLLTDGPLGVGAGWLDPRARRPRLRGRNGRAHQRRYRRPRSGDGHRPEKRASVRKRSSPTTSR